MSPLLEALTTFEEHTRTLGINACRSYRPGLRAEQVGTALRAEGLAAHPDLLTWYQWHDGNFDTAFSEPPPVDAGPWGSLHVLPTVMFWSLRAALLSRRWYRDEAVIKEGLAFPEWTETMLPIFDGPAQGMTWFDTDNGVIGAMIDNDYLVAAQTLVELVERWNSRFRDGVYYRNDRGNIDERDELLVNRDGPGYSRL